MFDFLRSSKLNSFHDYYAFLSHRHQDHGFAKRLQKMLEKQSISDYIPNNRKTDFGIYTNSFKHILLDEHDLHKAELKDDIIKRLRESDKLIVLCSLSSANPPQDQKWGHNINWTCDPVKNGWIGFEIQTFMDKNPVETPYKGIIPVIVEGDPEKGECFHPLIKSEIDKGNLKWFDLRIPKPYEIRKRNIWRHNFKALCAAILCPDNEDDFYQVYHKRDKARRIRQLCISSLITALVLLGGIKICKYTIPQKKYYQDYVLKYGLPEGIQELSKEDISSRSTHYTIIRQFNKIVELRHENSAGTLIPYDDINDVITDRPVMMKYLYENNNRLSQVICYDNFENQTQTLAYSDNMRIIDLKGTTDNVYNDIQYTLTDPTASAISHSTAWLENGTQSQKNLGYSHSSIVRYLVDYDSNGMIKEMRYVSNPLTNQATMDENGVAGLSYEYDDMGHIIRIGYLTTSVLNCVSAEEKSNYMQGETNKGVHATEYIYEHGELKEVQALGRDGALIINGDNLWAGKAVTHDSSGNADKIDYYDSDSNLLFSYLYEYNDKGLIINRSLLSFQNEKVLVSKFSYDSSGRIIEEAYYDSSDNPINMLLGSAAIRVYRESDGTIYKQEFYNSDGVLCYNNILGACSIITEYGNNGLNCDHLYYIDESNLGSNKKGVARESTTYDTEGHLTEYWCYDENGEKANREEGFSGVKYDYDYKGNRIRESYYDNNGELTIADISPIPCAICEYSYDEFGNTIQVRQFDSDGTFVDNTYAYCEYTYDEKNRRISWKYSRTDMDPLSEVKYFYDERGNIIKETHFDESGTLLFKTIKQYDSCNNCITEYKTTEDEKTPIKNDYDVVFTVKTYDELQNEMGIFYSDINETPVENEQGYAACIVTRDLYSHITSKAYYDRNRKLIGIGNDKVAYVNLEYSACGNIESITFRGADLLPANINGNISHFQIYYNSSGEITDYMGSSYDSEKALCNTADGWAVLKIDNNNKLTFLNKNMEAVSLDEEAVERARSSVLSVLEYVGDMNVGVSFSGNTIQ